MQFICLKEKKFHRSLSFCLVFFISFSIFCFGFGTKKTVKANPLISVFENEFAPIVVNILSSFGIVISIPTAQDFLQQEKDYQYNLQMEFQKKIDEKIEARKALAQMGIQALEKGYLVSKEFVKDILAKWEDYSSKNNLESSSQADSLSITFPNVYKFYDNDYIHSSTIDSYYTNCLKSFTPYVPSNIEKFEIWLSYDGSFGTSPWGRTLRKSRPEYFGTRLTFSYEDGSLMVCGNPYLIRLFKGFDGVKIKFGDYVTKPKINKKVIDNVLDPVNPKSQGIVISPENVEAVGKVLDPSIPDVAGSSIVNTAPISSVATTVPQVVTGADVGALPWSDVGSIDKPTDIPKDESKDVPKDEPIDKPKENEGVDFSPFLTLGSGLKDVFPFCLPFDLIKNLHLLSAPPQAPHFDIDFKKAGLAGGDIVSIDFSQFELLAKIIRFFLTLGFIYFLIIKTRDMIRG